MTDKKPNRITAEQFREAWRTVWDRDERTEGETEGELAKIYRGYPSTPITDYMLKSKNAFLRRVGHELGITERNGGLITQDSHGLFKLDMAYVADWADGYPPFIDVMIEHENTVGEIRNEMWKLMFLRSPLKVIVSYVSGPKQDSQWGEVCDMLPKSMALFPENEATEYLFIAGNVDNGQMHWRWASNKERQLRELC